MAIVESRLRYLCGLVRILLRGFRDATAYKHRPSNAGAYLTKQTLSWGFGFDPSHPPRIYAKISSILYPLS
jgi:hypothetical protein